MLSRLSSDDIGIARNSFSKYANPDLYADVSPEIEQIRELKFLPNMDESISLEEMVKKRDSFEWQSQQNGQTYFFKAHSLNFFRYDIPDFKTDAVIVVFSYRFAKEPDGIGMDCYIISKNGKEAKLVPIHGRYLTYKIEKEFFGGSLIGRSKSEKFHLFGPFPLTVYEPETFFIIVARDQRWLGYIIGIIAIMSLYNLGMLILFRKIYLLYYLLYSISVLLQFCQTSGLFGGGNLSVLTFYLANISMGIFIILFSMEVIGFKRRSAEFYIGTFLIGIDSALVLSVLAGSELPAKTMLLAAPPTLCFCFYLAARSAYNGYKPAYAMMTGWSGLLVAFTLVVMQFMISGFPSMGWAPPIAVAFEIATFSFAMGQKLRMSELKFMKENKHAFFEMSKMVYPHQLEGIKRGASLESTMPTSTAHACVISFDIVGSSKIKHINAKNFFRNVFTRCNEIISEGYDSKQLKANAYRIKEMGDGFLCSVGYPFQSMSSNSANDSIDLAKRFAKVLSEEALALHSEIPIACGIGIALDTLTGFYPEAGTKEYDLYGQAIVLATRYEGMRKTLFEADKGRSVLIIQEVVYQSLDPSHRSGFTPMDLKALGVVVRDDPAATKIYYQFIDQKVVEDAEIDRHVKVV